MSDTRDIKQNHAGRQADRRLYLLAPVAIVLMAALLYWIDTNHFKHAYTDQQVEYTRASEQLLKVISTLPDLDNKSQDVRLGLLDTIASRPGVECSALGFPNGARLERGRNKTMCAQSSDTADVTVAKHNGYSLAVHYTPILLVRSNEMFLRLMLEALLCGLALAIALNSLLRDMNVNRELGVRFQAQKRAQRARVIAERVATEAEAHSKAKSNFLATMSHEIRTPLNGIVGMASLLSDSLSDETKRGYAQMISTSGHALLAILNDALDLSKIDAGKLTMHRETCELKLSISEAVDLFKGRAAEKDIDLVCVLDDSLPAFVYIDPMRLRQMLTNLISNAIKFTDHGGIVLSAIAVPGTPDSEHADIRIEVTDTGAGIAKNNVGGIFDRFSQASQPSQVRVQGTGLGLAICREIAELMQGSIEVDSKLGEGTTFTINLRLPVAEHPDNTMPAMMSKSVQPAAHDPANIMLVNNHCGIACDIKNRLKRRGYDITHVATCTQALTGISEGHTGPIIVNLDHKQGAIADMTAFLTEARQRKLKTIGISERPASLDHKLTSLIDVLLITPGPWDDLMREVAFATVGTETRISDAA